MRTHRSALIALLAIACGAPSPAVAPPATTAPVAAATATPPPTATPSPTPRPPWRPSTAPVLGQLASERLHTVVKGAEWGEVADFNGLPIPTAIIRPERRSDGYPLVVYLHSDAGLLDRDLYFASWLASEGFFTVVPCWQALLAQAGRALDCSQAAPRRTRAADVVKDVSAVADVARTLAGATTARVMVIGHSGGGAAAVLAASMGGKVSGAVALAAPYGGTADGRLAQRWGTTPIEQVAGLTIPLLIFHGTADVTAHFDSAKAYEKAAREAGKRIETIYVEKEGHDFWFVPELFTLELRQKLLAFLLRR